MVLERFMNLRMHRIDDKDTDVGDVVGKSKQTGGQIYENVHLHHAPKHKTLINIRDGVWA